MHTHHYYTKRHNVLECTACKHQHYLFAGTIFQDNTLELYKFILGLYLFFSSHKGCSGIEMCSTLDVNYKTALRLCRKCRILMAQSNSNTLLDGLFYESDSDFRYIRTLFHITCVIGAIKKLIMNKNNSKYLIDASLENIFDLNLLMDGKSYQPNTKVSVSLKLEKDLLSKKLSIIYIDVLGNITVIPSVVKDEYITFETTHFSYYGIVAYNEKKSDEVKTSDESNNVLPFVLMIGAIVVICSLVMKKKKED